MSSMLELQNLFFNTTIQSCALRRRSERNCRKMWLHLLIYTFTLCKLHIYGSSSFWCSVTFWYFNFPLQVRGLHLRIAVDTTRICLDALPVALFNKRDMSCKNMVRQYYSSLDHNIYFQILLLYWEILEFTETHQTMLSFQSLYVFWWAFQTMAFWI